MPVPYESLKVGDRVVYEDMANQPGRPGTITEIVTSVWGTQFRVARDDGTETVSDCRQNGWNFTDKKEG